jgi:methylmalonyl-CoA mutase N-terminal domain/subunit
LGESHENKYGNERAQMLKYHIQTSGRSLHARKIDFNDIRTTLQALYAIYDNCNSLHTNAYMKQLQRNGGICASCDGNSVDYQ